jgi:hypothetical protein
MAPTKIIDFVNVGGFTKLGFTPNSLVLSLDCCILYRCSFYDLLQIIFLDNSVA